MAVAPRTHRVGSPLLDIHKPVDRRLPPRSIDTIARSACRSIVQFQSAPDGTPLWVSDLEPGSTLDITAARIHALPTLHKAAADGLPPLANKGCIGAGIGIRIPIRRPKGKSEQALHVDTRMFNTLLRHVRALGERTATELKQRWRALQHATLSPSLIGDIARALNGIWK